MTLNKNTNRVSSYEETAVRVLVHRQARAEPVTEPAPMGALGLSPCSGPQPAPVWTVEPRFTKIPSCLLNTPSYMVPGIVGHSIQNFGPLGFTATFANVSLLTCKYENNIPAKH